MASKFHCTTDTAANLAHMVKSAISIQVLRNSQHFRTGPEGQNCIDQFNCLLSGSFLFPIDSFVSKELDLIN